MDVKTSSILKYLANVAEIGLDHIFLCFYIYKNEKKI